MRVEPLLLHLQQGLPADEVHALLQLHGKPQARLQRVVLIADLVAVERQLRLEPERVPGAEAAGQEPLLLARLQQGLPELGDVFGLHVDLEAVLAGVPRAGEDQGRHAGHRHVLRQAEGLQLRQHDAGRERLQDLLRQRPLQGQQGDLIRPVDELQVVQAGPLPGGVDPLPVLPGVAGVDHQPVAVLVQAVDEDVVDHGAVLVAHQRVLHPPDRQFGGVVGADELDEVQGLGPPHLKLAHVRHVEEARRLAHGPVLLDDAGVLHGHLPAAEGHHAARPASDAARTGASVSATRSPPHLAFACIVWPTSQGGYSPRERAKRGQPLHPGFGPLCALSPPVHSQTSCGDCR